MYKEFLKINSRKKSLKEMSKRHKETLHGRGYTKGK